jgi:hypothetical protein
MPAGKPDKVKCADCVHLHRKSKDENRWRFEMSICTIQRTPLGLPPCRWPNILRMCHDFKPRQTGD